MKRTCFPLALLMVVGCTAVACAPPAKKKDPLSLEDESKRGRPPGSTIEGTPIPPGPEAKPTPIAPPAVYAHSKDMLYILDTASNTASLVGEVTCLQPDEWLIDIAVDGRGAIFATSGNEFFSLDPATAACTSISRISSVLPEDQYPNSLSFVPKGTLDPDAEALVGYAFHPYYGLKDTYVRIDPASGAMSYVGNLNPEGAATLYESSGDLIALSNDGKRAFLTVKAATGGTDQLAEIDPRTGTILRIIGDTFQNDLFGLAYWGGKAYGFAGNGGVFALDMTTAASTSVAFNGAAGVIWYGAGVTTEVPTN
jgi:hypothetical protein